MALKKKRKIWAAKNRDLIRRHAKATYNRNIEKYREKKRSHYHKNKALYRQRDRRRRALELGAGGSHAPDQIEQMFAAQKGLCGVSICAVALHQHGTQKYHIDHITPLSRGGSDDITNLQLLCPSCNRKKARKTMDEYMNLVLAEYPATQIA